MNGPKFGGQVTAWLTTGVYENLRYPFLNENITSEVLEMSRLQRDYPDAYAHVGHRRVESPELRRALFRMIVIVELATVFVAWIGAAALVLAAGTLFAPDIAKVIGLVGAEMFTAIWAGFLIARNWWCYWFGHEGAQNTHFQMTLWGMTNVVLIAAS